ncbi:MAG TPA: hypothetical protein PKD74_00350 [Candidatus Dependentiae bacterium]|nr:hypothetical protein [Candidatus Dependentiae bacterium]
MKQIANRFLCCLALLSSYCLTADVIPYFAMRSQGFNAARELVGWQTTINKGCAESSYGSFSITPEYTRSFRSGCLAEYLFGEAINNSCPGKCNDGACTFFRVQGSQVSNRSENALLADNFYLPTDFDSQISINPVISNWLIDFNAYFGMDDCHPGWYFRIHTPLTHTRWDLNYCEDVNNKGINNYDAGYFNNTFVGVFDSPQGESVYGMARGNLLADFTQYISEGKALASGDTTYAGLSEARISTRALTKTGLAELTAALGWNFIACPDYHFGLQLRAAAPTGNRPNGQYLFEPIVGNGHHWELGGGMSTHFSIYKSKDECRDLSMYIDANVTHLFKSCQWRTFDLCGKPLSRYMLAMKFTQDVTNLNSVDGTPSAQFAQEFAPVANFSTIPVQVSYPVQADVVCKLALTNKNFQWDIGYDFWYRSCPKFVKKCDCGNTYAANTWGLKGTSFVYGFERTINDVLQPGVPLSSTQLNATIFNGTNPSGSTWNQNLGIDNPQFALTGQGTGLYTHQASVPNFQSVFTSVQPELLQDFALDFEAARAQGISHKIFTHVNYMWKQCECYTPYFGIGGEVEFAQRTQDATVDCCRNKACDLTQQAAKNLSTCSTYIEQKGKDFNDCVTAALSQWGIWIKAGLSYN